MILRWRNWEPIATEQIRDVSFGHPGIRYTLALYRRRRDGKVRRRRIHGHWTLNELKGTADREPVKVGAADTGGDDE